MFPKPNRLPHDAYTRVFRTGKRIQTDDFQILFLPNQLAVCRFAVQVGLKVSKLAVQRNRMKRLVRESIRLLTPKAKTGFDCVLIAKKNFSDIKSTDVENQIRQNMNPIFQ